MAAPSDAKADAKSDAKADAKSDGKPKGLSIYFCGSIRGEAPNKAYYRELITALQKYGEVLTAHIGFDVCEPVPIADHDIYERDMAWLRACDVVVAECTHPSLGVGYELAYAHAVCAKPILVVFNTHPNPLEPVVAGTPPPVTGKKLSGLIAGCPGVVSRTVSGVAEAVAAIDGFLKAMQLPKGKAATATTTPAAAPAAK